jgi:drug/metabolite transporter (DMT)-like permease
MKNVLVWWVTCLIWSSVWLFIKIGVNELPPISFAWMRLVIALAILIPVVVVRRIPLPSRRD